MLLLTSTWLRADAPDRARALFDEGRKLAAAHDHAGAIGKYAESLVADPNQADVHAFKAASHLSLGQTDNAQREIDIALKLDASDYRFSEIAGQIRIAQGQVKDGRALYEKAAQLSLKNAGAIYTDLAAALASRNDGALSGDIESALKSAAAADPPGAEALFQLGQSYANAGRQEGKAYLRKYLDLSAALPESKRDAEKMQVAKQLIRALEILQQTP